MRTRTNSDYSPTDYSNKKEPYDGTKHTQSPGYSLTSAHVLTCSHTHTHTCTEHTLAYTAGQWGLLRKNSTCSSIWKLFREASNSIRAGLIAVASSQSPNHSVSQLAPRPSTRTHTHQHTYTICTTDSHSHPSAVGSAREWESIGGLPATPEAPTAPPLLPPPTLS